MSQLSSKTRLSLASGFLGNTNYKLTCQRQRSLNFLEYLALDVTANCICEIHCIAPDGFDLYTVYQQSSKEKPSPLSRDSNQGLLGGKQDCYLGATQPPEDKSYLKTPSLKNNITPDVSNNLLPIILCDSYSNLMMTSVPKMTQKKTSLIASHYLFTETSKHVHKHL